MDVKRIWRSGAFVCFCTLFCFFVPMHTLAEENRTWQDEIVYAVMIDRFNNGDMKNDKEIGVGNLEAYQGGDIQGIIKRLDYIQGMGFTTIMLSPFVQSETYDGSGVMDFQKVNEHFGTLQDVKQLVQEVHKRDMKVIFQFVVEQEQQQVIDSMKWWVKETDVDGIYLIYSQAISQPFLDHIQQSMQGLKEDFVVLNGEEELHHEYYKQITNAFSEPDQSIQQLYDVSVIENGEVTATFLDNQDTKRFVRIAKENGYYPPARLKLALTYLYTSPGVPIVYYGTEIALDGGEVPDNRRLMDFKTDEEFLRYVTKLGEIRQNLPSLRHGTFDLLYDQNGMSVFKRTYQDEVTLVAINNTKETKKVSVSTSQIGKNKELKGLLEDELIREEDGKYYLVLEREEANVYQAREKTGINWLFVSLLIGVNVLFLAFLIAVKKRGA